MHPAQRSQRVDIFLGSEDASLHMSRNDVGSHDLHEEEIRTALERLLDDRRLHMSERNRRFLRFVVEEKLAGRAERIKSYSIAVDVFGRAPNFDGLTDPIVRIEATRIRAALDAFYQGPGAREPVVFDLPKGGYVPKFRRHASDAHTSAVSSSTRQAVPSIRTSLGRRTILVGGAVSGAILCGAVLLALLGPWKALPDTQAPIIALEPVRSISSAGREAEFAQGLTQSIISGLSRFRGMRLVHLREGTRIPDPAADADEAPVYRMESTVRMSEDAFRFWWSLVDARSGRTLWSETIDQPRQGKLDNAIEDEIAARVAARITQRDGMFGVESSKPWFEQPAGR